MSKIKIRRMTENDIDGVYKVETNSFAIPWSRKAFADELSNRIALYFVAESDGQIAGYAGMWEVADEGDITNIAVLPEYRGKGIGKMLLNELFSEAKQRKMSLITLEVRESNHVARHLYKSCGFENVGIRKNYYADNRENAVIMTASLKG